MRKTDFRFTDKKRLSLADIVLAAGPMEERKALGIAKALCSRLIDETGLSESDLTAFNPNTILLSSKNLSLFILPQNKEKYKGKDKS